MVATLVWISGASGGIGRALAETLPWGDARVIDISRSGAEGLEHVAADLSRRSGWQTAAESFAKELEGFEGERAVFMHCSATLQPIGFAGEVDGEAYADQVVLNSAAPQVLGDAFVRAVAGRDLDAHLVIMTSGAATSVYPGWSAYCAGKAAVEHWVRTVGAEREKRGDRCRVIAVAPGTVATAMQERIRDTDPEDFPNVDKFIEKYEQGELRDPKDAARGIWEVVGRDLDNGAVVDLRDLGL